MTTRIAGLALAGWMAGSSGQAVDLVTKDMVRKQVDATTRFDLSNGIPVTLRREVSSEIVSVIVGFRVGDVSYTRDRSAVLTWLLSTMPRATKSLDRIEFFKHLGKYALSLDCDAAVEMATCELATTREYLSEGLLALGQVVREPRLAPEDAEWTRKRYLASLKQAPQNPDSFVNEVVNRVYYGSDHAFGKSYLDQIASLHALKPEELALEHARIVRPENLFLTVVGDLDTKVLQEALEGHFGKITAPKTPGLAPGPVDHKQPPYDSTRDLAIEHRKVPTAYMRLKFDLPGAKDPDGDGAALLVDLLDEAVGLEIRTKRSLSYAAHAQYLRNSVGVGVLHFSTSRPQEVLEALGDVILALRDGKIPDDEVDLTRRQFVTRYFLSQQTPSALGQALAAVGFFRREVDYFYGYPIRLGAYRSKDLEALAKRFLGRFRMGVIYDRDLFKDEWFRAFAAKTALTTP